MALTATRGNPTGIASVRTRSIPRKTLHAILLLAGVAVLLYANSWPNGFVFDDGLLVLHNPEIQNLALYPKLLEWDAKRSVSLPSDRGTTHRPLRTALLALEYYFFGRSPVGYRTVNILLHILNASLIFVILWSLLGAARPALFASLLFVAHPIQTESVAYISGQRDVLFTLWYLLGFWGFLRHRATGNVLPLGFAGLAYLLGLLTKEMAITLPLLCAVYDMVRYLPGAGPGVAPPLRKAVWDSLRGAITRDKWVYLVGGAMLASALFYFVFVANPSHQRALYGGGLGPTLNTSARIIVYYLKQLVFPLTLNADYSYDAFRVSTSLADPSGLLAGLLLAGIGFGLVCLLRLDRWAAFGGLWFFVTLLPVSQIIPHHELLAEHFLYLPSVGFCLVVGCVVERGLAVRRYAVAVTSAFAMIVLLFGVRTVVRNRDWADNLTLWMKTVQTAPQSARARLNLAQSLRERERYEEAIEQFRAYSAIDPESPSGEVGIADTYRLLGRYADALAHFRKAFELAPSSVTPIVGLAQTYAAMGQADKAAELSSRILAQFRDEQSYVRLGDAYKGAGLHARAVEAYRKGLELNPYSVWLLNGLGQAYAALGQHERAVETYREAVKLAPDSATLRNSLGAALLETDQPAPAAQALQEALQLAPDYAEAHNNLGIAYYRLGRQADAEGEFRRALTLQPASTEFRQNLALAQSRPADPSLVELERAVREGPASAKAHFNLGSAYGNQGDLTRAAQEFQRALQLDPTNPRIHYAVGLLRYRQSDREAARRAWERALQLDPAFALARERLAELDDSGGRASRVR